MTGSLFMVLFLVIWCTAHGMFSWFFCSSLSLGQSLGAWAPGMRFVRLSVSPSVAHRLCLLLFVRARMGLQARYSFHPPTDIQTLPLLMRDLGRKLFFSFFLHGNSLCFLPVQDSGKDWVFCPPPRAHLFCQLSVQVLMGKFLALPPVSHFFRWGEWDNYLLLLQRPITFPSF